MSASSPLSDREREILRLVATGLANKEIASALSISPNTVKVHLRNIFEKIGAASRTEAAMYAVREGLVEGLPAPAVVEAAPEARRPWWKSAWVWLGVGFAVAIFAGAGYFGWLLPRAAPTAGAPGATTTPAPTPSRWQARAPMLTARTGLAAAAYENQIYAIGGETDEGVTGALERYDPHTDTWTALEPKPLAVADIGAAVIGGKIYVPGGRMANGAPTDTLDIYDVRLARWLQGPRMPVATSAYALVAFEGKLYLFGGWDGRQYVASVSAFNPDSGQWEARKPMPTARGFAGAAVASSRAYVIGGRDLHGPLRANEVYLPENETLAGIPWENGAPLPEPRYAMGVASVAEIVFLAEGMCTRFCGASVLEYVPGRNDWQSVGGEPWPTASNSALVAVGPLLFRLGGRTSGTILANNDEYKAVYTVILP